MLRCVVCVVLCVSFVLCCVCCVVLCVLCCVCCVVLCVCMCVVYVLCWDGGRGGVRRSGRDKEKQEPHT